MTPHATNIEVSNLSSFPAVQARGFPRQVKTRNYAGPRYRGSKHGRILLFFSLFLRVAGKTKDMTVPRAMYSVTNIVRVKYLIDMYRVEFILFGTLLTQNSSADKPTRIEHGSGIALRLKWHPRVGLSGSVGSTTALHLSRRSRLQIYVSRKRCVLRENEVPVAEKRSRYRRCGDDKVTLTQVVSEKDEEGFLFLDAWETIAKFFRKSRCSTTIDNLQSPIPHFCEVV